MPEGPEAPGRLPEGRLKVWLQHLDRLTLVNSTFLEELELVRWFYCDVMVCTFLTSGSSSSHGPDISSVVEPSHRQHCMSLLIKISKRTKNTVLSGSD